MEYIFAAAVIGGVVYLVYRARGKAKAKRPVYPAPPRPDIPDNMDEK